MATRKELEQTSFLWGANAPFIEDLYGRYLDDAGSVDSSWRSYFDELGNETRDLFVKTRDAAQARPGGFSAGGSALAPVATTVGGAPVVSLSDERTKRLIRDHLRLVMLIRAFRVRGHLLAKLDPLGLVQPPPHPELDPATYGFGEEDMDREFFLEGMLGFDKATLREIVARLRETYAGSIGVEFMHIQHPEQKAWIQARVENTQNKTPLTAEDRVDILEQLTQAEVFEKFLQTKFPGTKRFGLDGGESAMPALETVVRRAAELGVDEIVLGMPHRGRLNVLANLMGKPYTAILAEFQGTGFPDEILGSGDVKYHLGTSRDRDLPDGRIVHLSLTANPSHLEAVDPVVSGKVRCKQRLKHDTDRSRVMGLLLHGDAAFAGQGVVHETLEMSELKGFRTGGTIHLIVNNQIGFTTSPAYARSSPYPSDVARGVQCPIFHVNADDPEAMVNVALMAVDFRQMFKRDVVIDMWCYRRNGHNEGDEPSFTQPLMYRQIAHHPSTRQIYSDVLVADGVLTPDEAEDIFKGIHGQLEEAFEAAKGYKVNKADWLEGVWSGIERAPQEYARGRTGANADLLREVGMSMTTLPPELQVHRRLERVIGERRKAIETGEGIDWATAEQLAFGTLLCEGYPVRLSGQDSGRGTFSQRHATIYDQQTEERYVPLDHLRPDQASFEVVDSFLSEEGVVGFEYGYSLSDPNALVLWEAQFGDFANGAQVYFDQFISSGEAKWLRMSALVCLLPHGYEGQGPEHSSARLERFLQLYAEDNMQIVYPSTPASYFHALRRQLHRPFRKPLIVMTPKSLLRLKRCVSTLEDMGPGSTFHRVLTEYDTDHARDAKIERVVICTGKVYYDLQAARAERGLDDTVAIVRLEQLAPFPQDAVGEALRRFSHAKSFVWCQEEPRNMGAWSFVGPRLEALLQELGADPFRPEYAGRRASASTATGYAAQHAREQAELVERALVG